jgi:hypothetical protein
LRSGFSAHLAPRHVHCVDYIFCETHEFKVPGLRRRLADEGASHVNLDWC